MNECFVFLWIGIAFAAVGFFALWRARVLLRECQITLRKAEELWPYKILKNSNEGRKYNI